MLRISRRLCEQSQRYCVAHDRFRLGRHMDDFSEHQTITCVIGSQTSRTSRIWVERKFEGAR